jgi:hypothetical protein
MVLVIVKMGHECKREGGINGKGIREGTGR